MAFQAEEGRNMAENGKEKKGVHPSHVTRFSDASTFDEICVNCGATDNPMGVRGEGPLGDLIYPCSKSPEDQTPQKDQ
jgi:hypothetical protein